MNWILLITFSITVIALIFFLVQQNLRDKDKIEDQFNENRSFIIEENTEAVIDEATL